MAVGAVVGAAVVVLSGIVPIKASSGHWRDHGGVPRFREDRDRWRRIRGAISARRRSTTTALVLRGAGHYETGCLPVPRRTGPRDAAGHGGDDTTAAGARSDGSRDGGRRSCSRSSSTASSSLACRRGPSSSETTKSGRWSRSCVACRPRRERRISGWLYGDGRRPPGRRGRRSSASRRSRCAVRDVCWRCHGVDGTGRGPGASRALPASEPVPVRSLRAFRDRQRFSGIMGEIASRLSDEAMREIAALLRTAASARTRSRLRRDPRSDGEAAIATNGMPGPRYSRLRRMSRSDRHFRRIAAYPKLSAQHARYLISQLTLLQERRRGGSPNVNLMHVSWTA